mgnify:CR=1 FL=1|jgi:hypothetical protein
MNSHTVKSNAKRHARKMCEKYPGFTPIEPREANRTGSWLPCVRDDRDDRSVVPDEIKATCLVASVATYVVVDEEGSTFPDESKSTHTVVADYHMEAEIAPAAQSPTARELVVAALNAPKIKSTPEEIAARRAERLARLPEKPAQNARGEKKNQIIAMLLRPEGATGKEMQEATGWCSHTVRGYISRDVRGLGFIVDRSGKVYKIIGRRDGLGGKK